MVAIAVLAAGVLVVGACGGDDGGSSGEATAGSPPPEPAAMCLAGESPVAAAYDIVQGSLRWAACTAGTGLYLPEAATDTAVYVSGGDASGQTGSIVSFDAGTGDERWSGDRARMDAELTDTADVPQRTAPVVDGVRLAGGQDDPVTGFDAATGTQLWTSPAVLVYDGVWAVGDGAVYAVDRAGAAVRAYEVSSGEVRWQRPGDQYLWPWHVSGERLFLMWNNLQVVDTGSGEVLWETNYPVPPSGFPRMMGGLANDDTLFVTFTTQRSGGD